MPDLIPGQLATVEFSLPDPPVSLPTVSAVIKKDADGVRSLVSGTSPGVLDDTATYTPAGNDYAAYFTVPADAVQGDTFLVRVVYAIGARQYSIWLVAGQVDFTDAVLAAVQADVDANTAAIAGIETDIGLIRAKTDMLGTAVANLIQGGILEGGEIALRVASYWSGTLTGLGDLTGYSKLWVTIKRSASDADAAAVVQWSDAGGLLYLDRNQGVQSSWGTLTIDDAAAGDITMTLEAEAAALLRCALNLVYDVKGLNAAGKPTPIAQGVARVEEVVTRAIA